MPLTCSGILSINNTICLPWSLSAAASRNCSLRPDMKLLCDVCENAVASLICCADEAALCLACDSRVHAANKLASKHQRMPLFSEASEPAVCDICQERPSFFFCTEDRALLCRECDVSIHSASTLSAKHRRFLLTGIQVGLSSFSSPSQETASAEQYMLGMSPPNSTAIAAKRSFKQAATTTNKNCGNDNGGLCNLGERSNRAAKKACKQAVRSTTLNCIKVNGGIGSKETFSPEKSNKASASAAMNVNVKSPRSYMINKQGTLSMPSNADSTDHRKAAMDNSSSNSTTISIQRISTGRVPFVAPVLSTLRAALKQEEASNNRNDHKNINISNIKGNISNNINNSNNIINNSNNNVMMYLDDSPPVQGNNVSDYLPSGIPGWRFDELLTDLVDVCESGSCLSPPKESNAPGFGIQEDPLWYAELDFTEEHELSPSQEEGVALVPEMPSPPTASGLVTSRGKPTCPVAQPWAFDYLFNDPHHSNNEFSVVPDIDGHRSSPSSTASPTARGSISKKRKFFLGV